MARWVVFGGTGYIGRALCRHLLASGQQVMSVSRAPSGPAGCEHLSLNLSDTSDLQQLFMPGDRVVYAAGLASRVACERQPKLAQWLNSDCPASLLALADNAGADSFIYLSSVKALCPPQGVVAGEGCGEPARDTYGRSKFDGEQQLLRSSGRCRVNVIRPAAVYGGSGEDVPGRASRWRGLLRNWGKALPLLPRSGYRSFVSLDDLVSAVELVAITPACDRQVFIAAEPRYYDLSAIVSAASGCNTSSSGRLTRWLLALLRPLQGMAFVKGLLELEQSELYSAARLRSAVSWRAERRYCQFLRGTS